MFQLDNRVYSLQYMICLTKRRHTFISKRNAHIFLSQRYKHQIISKGQICNASCSYFSFGERLCCYSIPLSTVPRMHYTDTLHKRCDSTHLVTSCLNRQHTSKTTVCVIILHRFSQAWQFQRLNTTESTSKIMQTAKRACVLKNDTVSRLLAA